MPLGNRRREKVSEIEMSIRSNRKSDVSDEDGSCSHMRCHWHGRSMRHDDQLFKQNEDARVKRGEDNKDERRRRAIHKEGDIIRR